MKGRKRRSRAELAEEYAQDRRFLLELWAILERIRRASALHSAALAPDEATAERLRQMADVPFVDLLMRGLENVEAQGRRASRTGIRLGLQDSLEFSRNFTPEEVRTADERMTTAEPST